MSKNNNKYRGILIAPITTIKGIFLTTIQKPIFWIFILALFVRLYKLDTYPVGLHVDEIKVGWNAFSILTTGTDDHGKRLGLYYDSFGDFRPTGIFYLTVPSLLLFGKTIFAIRFPSAFFGALSVFPVFLLANYIVSKQTNKKKSSRIGYLAALFLALSPWHIEVSRATSEPTISFFFALCAIYTFINFKKSKKIQLLFISAISILVSYLMYHSIRLLAPLLYIVTYYFFFKNSVLGHKKVITLTVVFVFFLTVLFSLNKNGVSRLSQVSIFTDVDTIYEIDRMQNETISKNLVSKIAASKEWIYTKNFIVNYSSYFSGNFLLGSSARPYRYTTPGVGLLTHVEFVLFLVGMFSVIKNKKTLWLIAMLLISPLPAAMTSEDAPNLHRALFMIPFICIAASLGAEKLLSHYKTNRNIGYLLVPILLTFNYIVFGYMYFNHSTTHKPFIKNFFVDSPTYRNVGSIELVKKVHLVANNYDKIIITNFPDTPFAWYAFFTNQDPSVINKSYSETTNQRLFNNIVFSEEKCPSDDAFSTNKESKLLVINSWECPHENQIKAGLPAKIVDKIQRADGSEVYIFIERI